MVGMADLTVEDEPLVLERTITLTNQEWHILAMCVETYTATFRTQKSEHIATYVTRGQLDQAVAQASEMNAMIAFLDKIQAKL